MREMLDTSSNYPEKEIPDGEHAFKVSLVSKKDIKGKPGYEWQLECDGVNVQILMWPNQMGPLLRILGVKEDAPNKFSFDTMEVEDKEFTATAYKDKKGYQQLKNYVAAKEKDEVPF